MIAQAQNKNDISEWPSVAGLVTLAVAVPLLILELLDVASLLAIHSHHSSVQGIVINSGMLALVPAYGVGTFWTSRKGTEGAYMAVLGVFLSLIICFNFRGSFIRPGTFDEFEYPSWSWTRYVVLGSILGIIAGVARVRKTIVRPVHWVDRVLLPLSVIGVGWVSYLLGEHYGVSSMWAPTRVYVLSCVGLLLAIIGMSAELSSKRS